MGSASDNFVIGMHEIVPRGGVYVVAEIGVNHDGSVKRALELVEVAKEVGADGVKLQVFKAKQLVHGEGVLAEYQKGTGVESSVELLKRYELSEGELGRVFWRARELKLGVVATPFSLGDVEACGRLGLDAVKIASPDVVNVPLLRRCGGLGLPMLVSTGAATLEEIDGARRLLSVMGVPHLLMHCVSSYPAPDSQAHLCFIWDLVKRYGPMVGYSDHAESVVSGALAVAAGAVLLERHLTYDVTASGPDHAASSDPKTFAAYVKLAREACVLRGTGKKRVLGVEGDVRKVSRQSIVTARAIGAGEVLREEDLVVQRPGTGVSAGMWDRVVGRRVKAAVGAGVMVEWGMLE